MNGAKRPKGSPKPKRCVDCAILQSGYRDKCWECGGKLEQRDKPLSHYVHKPEVKKCKEVSADSSHD